MTHTSNAAAARSCDAIASSASGSGSTSAGVCGRAPCVASPPETVTPEDRVGKHLGGESGEPAQLLVVPERHVLHERLGPRLQHVDFVGKNAMTSRYRDHRV